MPTNLFKKFLDESLERVPSDPTPEEIEKACARIQETWTHEERLHRAGIRYHYPRDNFSGGSKA